MEPDFGSLFDKLRAALESIRASVNAHSGAVARDDRIPNALHALRVTDDDKRDTRSRHRQNLVVQWVLAIGSWAAFGAAAYYAWVARDQLRAMQDQLSAMRKANENTATANTITASALAETQRQFNLAFPEQVKVRNATEAQLQLSERLAHAQTDPIPEFQIEVVAFEPIPRQPRNPGESDLQWRTFQTRRMQLSYSIHNNGMGDIIGQSSGFAFVYGEFGITAPSNPAPLCDSQVESLKKFPEREPLSGGATTKLHSVIDNYPITYGHRVTKAVGCVAYRSKHDPDHVHTYAIQSLIFIPDIPPKGSARTTVVPPYTAIPTTDPK